MALEISRRACPSQGAKALEAKRNSGYPRSPPAETRREGAREKARERSSLSPALEDHRLEEARQ